MLEISLIEWPPDGGGPCLLGRTTDPDLIESIRDQIAADRRQALAKIEGAEAVEGSE